MVLIISFTPIDEMLTNFSDEITILDTFSSPENALEFLKHNTPDCLFLDIQMPTTDGF